eukprot:1454086-Rhodomonas_salina.1
MKDRREKAHHHCVGFMKSQVNEDYDYVASASPWLPSTRIDSSEYTTAVLTLQSAPNLLKAVE